MPATPPALRVFLLLLRVFPRDFRRLYAAPMAQTAKDAYFGASPEARMAVLRLLIRDLAVSCAREYADTFWRCFMKRPVVLYSTCLFVLLAVLMAGSAIFTHTLLRKSADQPQAQMAERYASLLSAGADPATVLPAGHIDLSQDLDPFVMLYDEAGHLVQGNGYLGSSVPTVPAGVLEQARAHGSDAVSWRPRQGVRAALVVRHIAGARTGFVAVGRSLSVTERYEGHVYSWALHGFLLLFILIFLFAVLLTRAGRSTPMPRTA